MSIISHVIYSQDSCSYQNYWYYVGSATIDFSNEQYKEAAKKYKKAFSYKMFSWGSDLDLALKTAVKIKDTIWAKEIAVTLAKGGIPPKYFESVKEFTWYTQFIKDFKTYRDHFLTNFDQELRKSMFELRYQDSTFNSNYHKFRKGEIDLTLKELTSGAIQIKNRLVNLIKEHGFPCQQNMGYYFDGEKIYRFPVMIILHHTYQRGELLLKNNLSDRVCDGKLRPTDHTLLNRIRGYGDSSGIENEMKIKYDRIMKLRS